MITHKVLMKYFGKQLIRNYKGYQSKLNSFDDEALLEVFKDTSPNRGVNIRSLINFPHKIRATYREGEDGESIIDIKQGYFLEKIITLYSYGHTEVYFKRIPNYSPSSEKSTKLYNLFMPEDFLIQYKDRNYTIGSKYLPCRFDEVTFLYFDSSKRLSYGLNITHKATKPSTVRDFNKLTEFNILQFEAKVKLLGKFHTQTLWRKAKALKSDIQPKYMELLGHIVKKRAEASDIINLLVITHNYVPPPLHQHNTSYLSRMFRKAMKKEKPYILAIMEY